MSTKITIVELQAFLNGEITPEREAELKQNLYEKLFAKAIWTMEEHGIVEANQLDFAIEVSMEPAEAAEEKVSGPEGGNGSLYVTLRCCTGAGCGACGQILI